MTIADLKPMTYGDVLKKAYELGFRTINNGDLKDRIEEIEDGTDNKAYAPCYILIGNIIIDLNEAWDTDAYIDDLDY